MQLSNATMMLASNRGKEQALTSANDELRRCWRQRRRTNQTITNDFVRGFGWLGCNPANCSSSYSIIRRSCPRGVAAWELHEWPNSTRNWIIGIVHCCYLWMTKPCMAVNAKRSVVNDVEVDRNIEDTYVGDSIRIFFSNQNRWFLAHVTCCPQMIMHPLTSPLPQCRYHNAKRRTTT
ncbi:uncharacterized protein LOC129306440 [Prosopis cineraria]|uniref:uncharacterized protein LOC129306440 n=1 Tax=Prosopis cineraria TaxID=364024 RepID=UPI002410758D|nr:uncharacterized protein LOC129306440 [Prosopis cineraria]